MHENITYNPLQQETVKYVDIDCNLVVMAPTSSGKTIVAEQFIFPCIERGERALYLSPLKALTNEKLEAWRSLGLKVIAITSDYETHAIPIVEPLVLMTTEALDSRSRGNKPWLKAVKVLVCDEAHMLGVPSRGDALEVGLTRFSLLNPSARIIMLSATFPNTQDLVTWLTRLNGKPTYVVESDWRPVTLKHHLVNIPHIDYRFLPDCLHFIERKLSELHDKQALIFVHTINNGHTIARALNVPFHYSKLSKETRTSIEKAFRERTLKTLVSTSTLAYGVNLPADVGIIVGGHRGYSQVDSWDIKQMAGRIGRYGLSEAGEVYYLFANAYADSLWSELHNLPPIISQLEHRLYFHITSFVARENMQREAIQAFLQRTLANLNSELHVEESIDFLLQEGILLERDNLLIPTNIARASAFMYVDPIDLKELHSNLKAKPLDAKGIAVALASIPSLATYTYIPHDLHVEVELEFPAQTVLANCLIGWLSGRDLPSSALATVNQYVADFDRITSALTMCGTDKAYITQLSLMMKNGIFHSLLDIISVPGIGRKRALDLYHLGITSKEEILANKTLATNVLGKKVVANVEAIMQRKASGKLYIVY